jgi:signal transduction histidine kinase/DNA-binding response OmpR family regulator
LRILIIDDGPADRELAIRALDKEFAGAEFVEIGRRPELNDALARGGFDAVLSNFRLHWTDGFWVLNEIREHYPYVPVVFMTESGSEEIAVEAMKAGLSDYVLKHHTQRLPIALRESLEKSRLRQAAEGLERPVEERTAELSRRETELAQANQDLRSEMAERRRVEEERERLLAENQRQRELLEHLIAAAPIGIAVLRSSDMCYELANRAYLAITGKPADLPGQSFGRVSPDLAELAAELLQPACETGETVSIREFGRAAQGQRGEGYWDLDAVPLHGAAGDVVDVLVLVNDVSQKVLARRKLEELAEALRWTRDELEERVQERTAALEAANEILSQQQQRLQLLNEVDQAILAAQSPAAIAAAAMGSLVEATGALGAMVILFDSKSKRAEVLAAHGLRSDTLPDTLLLAGDWLFDENRQGRPGIVEDVAALPDDDPLRGPVLAAGVRCYAGVPLLVAGQVIGAVVMAYAEPGPLADAILGFVHQVADQLAVAIHQARLFDEVKRNQQQLRMLSHHLVAIQEEERKSLSRELHDRSGQSMSALKLGLGMLRREAEDADLVRAHVEDLLVTADEAMTELHELAVNLRPSALDHHGLAPAVAQYLTSFRKKNQLEVEYLATGLDGERLPEDIETAIYRIMQEALTNVIRHAQATKVAIIMGRRNDEVSLIIEDNGRGFDVEEALRRGRLGLLGMRERSEMLGGTVTIESAPGRGTTLYVQAPVPLVS